MMRDDLTPRKAGELTSEGHVAFVDGEELFRQDGEVYAAPRAAPFGIDGHRLGAMHVKIGDCTEAVLRREGRLN